MNEARDIPATASWMPSGEAAPAPRKAWHIPSWKT